VKLVFSILITLAAGAVSGFATAHNVDTWYTTLNKPWFNPPNWLFAPVWTLLYIMMGVALYFIWRMPASPKRNIAMVVFFIQLFLNFLWSFIFFYFHAIAAALADIIVLWTAIFITILLFSRLKTSATWLMIPYICWVSFAMVLNISILQLNQTVH
jgi:tryptophan-rich sensory protein